MSAPTMATSVKQGDRSTVTLSVNRGSAFGEAVSLKATAPPGITATLNNPRVAPNEGRDVALTIEAAKDAPLGEHVVTISATPEKGSATSVDVKVKVEEKPKN
ncbi:MAG: NEW3 domain-containing protein [Gemmataceae bacterium]